MSTSPVEPTPPRRPRHLMDPAAPRRPVDDHRLTNVQRWVFSVLTVFTIAHLAVGIVFAAVALPADSVVPRIGLCVIAGLFGIGGVMAGLLIHRRSVLTPWLVLGLLPTAIGLWLVLR